MKKYDSYKDSGIEWIGEIPLHWNIRKLKFVCKIFNGDSLKDEEKELYSQEIENAIPYVSTKDIDVWTSKINYENGLSIPVDHSRYKIAPKNSFLMCIEGGSAGRKYSHLEKDVFFVNKLACFETKSENNKFLYYYSQSPLFQSQFQNSLSGLIGGVAISQIRNFSVILPIPEEQTTIANYLDQKTTQIDDLIAKKERLIQLLEEERTAIINELVTGKKVWNGHAWTEPAEVKDSGIEWLGEIPEHWEVKKLKYISKIFRGKFSHRPRNDERLYNGIYPFFQTGDVAKADKILSNYSQTLNDLGLNVSTLFTKGTIVMTIAANIGDVAILGIDGCFPDSIVGFEPNDSIQKDYLFHVLKNMKDEFIQSSIKNTQLNLNIERISTSIIALPPLNEQIEISNHIDCRTTEIISIVSKTQQEIELLKEYKTALISEVVTGKVDVSTSSTQVLGTKN